MKEHAKLATTRVYVLSTFRINNLHCAASKLVALLYGKFVASQRIVYRLRNRAKPLATSAEVVCVLYDASIRYFEDAA
jgi:hypothetical protein